MRILVNDFGGYGFPFDLSRELARRGHNVMHAYCASIPTTPLGVWPTNPLAGLQIESIHLAKPLAKYRFFQRRRQEIEYGIRSKQLLQQYEPDVLLSANMPLDAQKILLDAAKTNQVRFVYWLQDLIGVATERILTQKIPLIGRSIGRYYRSMETRLLQQSDHVVTISSQFAEKLDQIGIQKSKRLMQPNWAPQDGISVMPKSNAWAQAQQLQDRFCFLYSGTLSMKHNPALLLRLAQHFQDDEAVRIVVLSQGKGMDWLRAQQKKSPLSNLVLLPYQPAEQLSEVLATGDVLVAVLQPEASTFSVPSKVMSYLSAGRPILGAIPATNDAARIIKKAEAGLLVEPEDDLAFLAAATQMRNESDLKGGNARQYAEKAFAIGPIADQFETVLGVDTPLKSAISPE